MFFQGFINENLEPVVENIPLDAILDTGFNGMFCIPRRLAPHCELISLGLETFELADGTLVDEELYVGQILLNDVPYFVELTLTDADQALVGMQMLLDKIAIFNLKTMRIEVMGRSVVERGTREGGAEEQGAREARWRGKADGWSVTSGRGRVELIREWGRR